MTALVEFGTVTTPKRTISIVSTKMVKHMMSIYKHSSFRLKMLGEKYQNHIQMDL